MTDKQRLRRLQGALKAALVALQPLVAGTYWINRAQCKRAAKAIERGTRAMQ